jgi:Fe-Mn family superoxide dismutase
MAPQAGGQPVGELLEAIKSEWGDVAKFQDEFNQAALNRFGSGWAWLVLESGKLHVGSTPNQDNPVMKGNTPIIGIDVWEHAYYLKYQNKRADYVTAWWSVVNWEKAGERYSNAKQKA